jgi:hypothetical protein
VAPGPGCRPVLVGPGASVAHDLDHYSAWHALLVAVACALSAQHLPEVIEGASQGALVRAALTMNLSMSHLHNRLGRPVRRDLSDPQFAVRRSLAPHEVGLSLALNA